MNPLLFIGAFKFSICNCPKGAHPGGLPPTWFHMPEQRKWYKNQEEVAVFVAQKTK